MSAALLSTIAFAGSAAVVLALTPCVRRLACTFGFVDQPDARKIHAKPIPRIGGIAIAAGVLLVAIPMVLFVRHASNIHPDNAPIIALLVASAFVLSVGVLDDFINVRSTYKLAALIFAGLLLCAAGGSIDSVVIRDHTLLEFSRLSWPITLLWIVVVTVSVNFIDGLDGLAAGIVAAAAAVLAVGAWVTDQPAIALIMLTLAGSLSGFLYFNFNPASIFMGDSGSMFIGFLLAGAGVLCAKRGGSAPGILLPAVVLIVPLLDTNLALIRRGILQRRSIFSPERGHIHHRLLDAGLCHKHAVLLLYGITTTAAITALMLRFAGTHLAIAAVLVLVVMVAILFRTSGSPLGREIIAAIRRNRAISRESRKYQNAFENAQLRFRNARTFADWWDNVCFAANALNFASITLPMTSRDGDPRIHSWSAAPAFASGVEIPAHLNGHADGNGHALRNGSAAGDHADPPANDLSHPRASLPIADRRSGPPIVAQIELNNHSTLECAGHRITLFARLMEEHSLAALPDQANPKADLKIQEPAAPFIADGSSPVVDSPTAKLKVAVVHDFLYTYAGAERVLEQILAIYPQADLFSLFDFLPPGQRGFIQNKPVTASFLQRLPFARNHHRAFLPLMPMAIEQFDLSGYDLVISSSYCAAKGVITSPRQLHVCYCHTPVRYAWDLQPQYTNQKGLRNLARSFIARAVFHYIRNWDVRSANGVDLFIANSQFVSQRIQKTYRRNSIVVHPPVDTELFTLREQKEDFYLTASRLVPYKRIDLIVEAFKHLPDKKLIVIGDGPEMPRIKALAGPNVRLLGHQPAERLRHYMQLAKGFIFAAEEDFGIVPVEAQACGTPVLAYAQGGALETILPGQTGLFFKEQSVESLLTALTEFDQMEWTASAIHHQAERFSQSRFQNELGAFLNQEWLRFRQGQHTSVNALRLTDQLLNSIAPIGDVSHAQPEMVSAIVP